MAYERPGVYVQEGTFATNLTTANGPTAAAFVGTAERGPTTPTLVTSWSQYTSLFGALDINYDLGYAVYHYFANGGQAAYVTRVIDATATYAYSALTATPTGGSLGNLVRPGSPEHLVYPVVLEDQASLEHPVNLEGPEHLRYLLLSIR